ncbi:MAG: hypothetical protein QM673_04770 [Gordonia sp. (in: high G+C Gram-positive bacteria)]
MSTPYPDPPFSADLLADLHAGVLPDDIAAHVRAYLPHDRAAAEILKALDRTVDDLRSISIDQLPVPPEVVLRSQRTVAAIADETRARSIHRSPPDATRYYSSTRARTHGSTGPARRRSTGRRSHVAVAATVSLVAAAVAITVGILTSVLPRSHRDEPTVTAQQSTPTVPPATLGSAERVAALSVLGSTSAAPFGSATALRACTAANGVPSTTPVLGSGEIMVGSVSRIVILLATGVAGRFDALVVAHGCGRGNPATVSRTTIGG